MDVSWLFERVEIGWMLAWVFGERDVVNAGMAFCGGEMVMNVT